MIIPLLIALVLPVSPAQDELDAAKTALANLAQVQSRVTRSVERVELVGRELTELLKVASGPTPEPPSRIETYPDVAPDELRARFEAWRDHRVSIEQRATAAERSRERSASQAEVFDDLRDGVTDLVTSIEALEVALGAVDQLMAAASIDAAQAATALGLSDWSLGPQRLAAARSLSAGLPDRITAMLEAETATLTALSTVDTVADELISEATIQADASEILMSVIIMERVKRDALVKAGPAGLQTALDRADAGLGAIVSLERLAEESRQVWDDLISLDEARKSRRPPGRDDFASTDGGEGVLDARGEVAWCKAMIAYHRETLALLVKRHAGLVTLQESMDAGGALVRDAGAALVRFRSAPQARALLADPTGAQVTEYSDIDGKDVWTLLKSVALVEARRGLVQEIIEERLSTHELEESATAALEAQIETVNRAGRMLLEREGYADLLEEMSELSDSMLLAELDPDGEFVKALQAARREASARTARLGALEALLPEYVARVASHDTPYAERQIHTNPGRTQKIREELGVLTKENEGHLPRDTSNEDDRWESITPVSYRSVEPNDLGVEEELLSPSKAQLTALRVAQRSAQERLRYYLKLESLTAELRAATDEYVAAVELARVAIGARLALERRLHVAQQEVQRRRQSGALPDARVPAGLVSALPLESIAEIIQERALLGASASATRLILRSELSQQDLILAWKPWAEVGGEVAQQNINLIAQPVLHVESARKAVDELPDFERGNLQYTAHELAMEERTALERILAPLAKPERRARFEETLEAYYEALVNLERVTDEYRQAQEAYRQLIELNESSREDLRGALDAMQSLERTRLRDYMQNRVFAAIAANPSRRIRITAECGLELPALLDDQDWDERAWGESLAASEARLWGDRARIAELEWQLSREGIESDINAFGTHIAHIGTEIEEKEDVSERLRVRVRELRASYRDELGRHALWTLFKVALIPLLAILVVRALMSLSGKIRANARGVIGSPDRIRRLETLTNVSTAAIRAVVWMLAGIYMLAFLGLDITPIIASASVVGLAVAFGAQALVKDFFAGFFLLLEHQYSVGDVVDLGIASGKVEHISLRMTTLRDLKGTVHYVPNGLVQRVANKTKGWSQIVMEVGFPYDEDVDRVTGILREVLEDLASDEQTGPNIIGEPTVAGVQSLGESSIDLRVMVKVQPGEQWAVARELRRRIRRRFDAEGIKAPYPQRIIHRLDYDPSAPGSLAHDDATD